MLGKFYPVILAAITESKVRMKIIHNADEYAAFCEEFLKPGVEFREVPTIEAVVEERRAKWLLGLH